MKWEKNLGTLEQHRILADGIAAFQKMDYHPFNVMTSLFEYSVCIKIFVR